MDRYHIYGCGGGDCKQYQKLPGMRFFSTHELTGALATAPCLSLAKTFAKLEQSAGKQNSEMRTHFELLVKPNPISPKCISEHQTSWTCAMMGKNNNSILKMYLTLFSKVLYFIPFNFIIFL